MKQGGMIRLLLLFSGMLLLPPNRTLSQTTTRDITAADIRERIQFLASDELEGRASGTVGNEKAARYIAREFERCGLTPAGDDGTYFQKFDFVSSVEMGEHNVLKFQSTGIQERNLTPGTDFIPFGFSSPDSATAGVVFAGYGISVPDQGYDDYAHLDVTGKIVIALRYSPEGDDPHGELSRHGTFRSKARVAREKGAKGLLIINGPLDDPDDELVELSFDQAFANSGLPVASMKRSVVDDLLRPLHLNLKTIQDSINASRSPVTFQFEDLSATVKFEIRHINATTSNIVGYLPGDDAQRGGQALVIGAHMDHLGFGGRGSGSLEPDNHAIHNGADDNASGTAGLLEIAERYGSGGIHHARTILFIAFSGEELGTLGSGYYVNHPFFPLDSTVAMLNMDMVGRLEDNKLTVYGTGTSPEWDDLLKSHDIDSTFTVSRVEDGYGPSDHAQFYGKDIPVLFFFTGTHNDYHKPSDDWDKINFEGEARVLKMVDAIAGDLAGPGERPQFTKVESSARESGIASFRVTLGVVPDYASSEEGMKIGGVRPGGTAEKAGIQPGDLIVGMKGKKIMNIYDYMDVLGELRPGDVLEVEVMRGTDRIKLTAEMQK